MIPEARIKEGRLILETGRARYMADWNNGDVRGLSLEDTADNIRWDLQGALPDLSLPGAPEPEKGALDCREVPAGPIRPAHLEAVNTFTLGSLEIKRVFRLYPDCPAIGCDLFLRGRAPEAWTTRELLKNSQPIENIRLALEKKMPLPVMTRFHFNNTSHLKLKCVEFLDRTDYNNNLVLEREYLPYPMPSGLRGSLLLIRDAEKRRGLFLLKEGALCDMQIGYPGYDFIVSLGHVILTGMGVMAEDIRPDAWTRVYGFAMGAGPECEQGLLSNLRAYQEALRVQIPERDSMVLMNTWGDRGQDRSIGETFALKEIEAAKRLSISRFQLDDGWQAGRTLNSATPGGTLSSMWEKGGFWAPHPERFPNGLKAVVDKAGASGVELCLWFNPCADDSYANWEKDADCLIDLFRQYGIRTFKIDGVEIPDKASETRLRAMFDKILMATEGTAVFNLDVTAGRRFGYFWFNEYGNRFLENRYTDWRNYYPHWTLRNLWVLSRFIPPQSLQIEFLNKWRNADKYGPDDPLAPARVPFDYCFAVAMAAQPLAWFEGSRLPAEAFSIAPLIESYRKIQPELHACRIFPIGNAPDGFSWTGFQAVGRGKGFVLVYREKSPEGTALVLLWDAPGEKLRFEPVLGRGAGFSAKPDKDNGVVFSLPAPFTFCLYRYAFE